MPHSMRLPYDEVDDPSTRYLESFLASRRTNLLKKRQQLEADLPFSMRQVNIAAVSTDATSSTEPQSLRDEIQEPVPKKRRFQRRNSKTPAMLLNSLSDILGKCDDCETMPSKPVSLESSSAYSARDQVLERGLQIAQELVRQLKLRKQRKEAGATKSGPTVL